MSLKLVSINIEAHKHLESRILPFLVAEKPDFVSLQEVFEVDIPVLEKTLGMKSRFLPQANVTQASIHLPDPLGPWGVAQFTYLPVIDEGDFYYYGQDDHVPTFFENNDPNSMNRGFLWQTVEYQGQHYTLGTTHFTWSPDGSSTPEQQRDLNSLLAGLNSLPGLVFSGDMNAPRGGSTFAQLAALYTDNIPAHVTTSIDGELHRAGALELMVDGLFSTPGYRISEVEVVGGVSDHKAITALVTKLY